MKLFYVGAVVGLLLGGCQADAPQRRSGSDGFGHETPIARDDVRTERVSSAAASPVEHTEKAFVRRCMQQADCPEGLACVAESPRRLVCKEVEGELPPRTVMGGRPVPPVGLIEGDVMRAAIAEGATP